MAARAPLVRPRGVRESVVFQTTRSIVDDAVRRAFSVSRTILDKPTDTSLVRRITCFMTRGHETVLPSSEDPASRRISQATRSQVKNNEILQFDLILPRI